MSKKSNLRIPALLLVLGFFLSCSSQSGENMEGDHKYTNRLAKESSPYLLQHAHNPVDWYPWGEEALERAKAEDKPIIVSIGYAACHWCHVMEKESFEDTAVANFMNEHFVNIKIDREERPDIDQIYMDAVQALTRSGGWPLNVFLTPDAKPFDGGTYFPPEPRFNKPSWMQVIKRIKKMFTENRTDVEDRAAQLTTYLEQADKNILTELPTSELGAGEEVFKPEQFSDIFAKFQETFDSREGGFGAAPKFPGTMNIQFLLRYYHFTGNQDAYNHATLSLDKMIMGGIYDQLGGGFARYSTDAKWLVPHFEKMLYDNALLMSVIAEAYTIDPKPLYKETMEEIYQWLVREMTTDEGGFYATLDADSEGEEGKFYIWQKSEIDSVLGDRSELFCKFYDVTEHGNWEESNILNRKISMTAFAEQEGMGLEALKKELEEAKSVLFNVREKRLRPGLDDKILLGWNGMMISGLADAYRATGNKEYLKLAERNADFLLDKFRVNKKSWAFYHTYKDGEAKIIGVLEDYAFLIRGLLNLYQVNFDEDLLSAADNITTYVVENFQDKNDGLFYFTDAKQTDVIMRKKEFYDGAVPSGNSTMAHNLQYLGIIMDKPEYSETAIRNIKQMESAIAEYPGSFSRWINVMVNYAWPMHEIAVVGGDYHGMASKINGMFIPNKIIMGTKGEDESKFPLLEGKYGLDETMIYVCRNYACKLPVNNISDFKEQIN